MEILERSRLLKLAVELDELEREGAATDEPEGARWVRVSDTLLRRLANGLRMAALP